jgi:hypothetical protein
MANDRMMQLPNPNVLQAMLMTSFVQKCSWHLAIITQFNGQQVNENITHARRPIQRQTKTCIVAGRVPNDL